MRRTTLSLLALLAATPAAAQETDSAPRYVFTPVEEGAFRLNTETGEVSLCAGMPGSRSCTIVPDEAREAAASAPPEERIAALEARIASLEARIAEQGDVTDDEESMERVLTLTDRMLRQFFGLVREMKRDLQGETL